MTEAVKPVTDYAFDVLGFEELVLANTVGNPTSRRIKETAGAVFLRTGPAVYVNPSYTEREVWELAKGMLEGIQNFSLLHDLNAPSAQSAEVSLWADPTAALNMRVLQRTNSLIHLSVC